MKGPYGLELNDGCKTCKRKAAGFFCQLSPAALKDFDAIKSTSTYPKGAFLFMERQDARGVFVLCEGEVKLSISHESCQIWRDPGPACGNVGGPL